MSDFFINLAMVFMASVAYVLVMWMLTEINERTKMLNRAVAGWLFIAAIVGCMVTVAAILTWGIS